MHPLNQHTSYDFVKLKLAFPELSQFVFVNQYGTETVDFSNANAVKAINKAILLANYSIEFWDIPVGFLCPPIPGRIDYLYYLADLTEKKQVKILDIGTGANCIYPLLGVKAFNWSFVATDINKIALKNAELIVKANNLEKNIELRLQKNNKKIFDGVFNETDRFDFTMCNPPFHDSEQAAMESNQRKNSHLNIKGLNFGGLENELYTEGGEAYFLKKMIEESKAFGHQCTWFTSLVSKKETIEKMQKVLKRSGVLNNKVIEMRQGQKISRILAWTFI